MPSKKELRPLFLIFGTIFVFGFGLGFGLDAQARGGSLKTVDLNHGVAFPSNNWTLWENPAALGDYSDEIFEFGWMPEYASDVSFRTSFVGQASGFGWGVGAQRLGTDLRPILGFGYGFSNFQFGLAASSSVSWFQFPPATDLGLRYGASDRATMGLVVRNFLSGLSVWDLGVGVPFSNVLVEGDLRFTHAGGGSFALSSVSGRLNLSVHASKVFMFRVGYGFGIMPTLVLDPLSSFEAGLAFWLGQKWCLWGNLRTSALGTIVGFKYSM